MATPISKMAPTAVVVVAVSYCAGRTSSRPLPRPTASRPRRCRRLPRRSFRRSSRRLPRAILFGRRAAAARPSDAKKTAAARTARRPIAARQRITAAATAPAATKTAADPLDGLALTATSVFGEATAGGHQWADLRGAGADQEQGRVGPAVRCRPDSARSGAPGMRGPHGDAALCGRRCDAESDQANGGGPAFDGGSRRGPNLAAFPVRRPRSQPSL